MLGGRTRMERLPGRWIARRETFLRGFVDGIERLLGLSPTVSGLDLFGHGKILSEAHHQPGIE
jgi:hypothetical protein